MKKIILASGTALMLTMGAAEAQDKTLTISVYAFAQDEFKELVYTPFEQKCGCKLVVETGNSVERLAKMEANKANPVVDLAIVSMADALSATRKDLIQKIDASKVQLRLAQAGGAFRRPAAARGAGALHGHGAEGAPAR